MYVHKLNARLTTLKNLSFADIVHRLRLYRGQQINFEMMRNRASDHDEIYIKPTSTYHVNLAALLLYTKPNSCKFIAQQRRGFYVSDETNP